MSTWTTEDADELEILINDRQAEFFERLEGLRRGDVNVAGMVGGIGSGKSIAMSDLMKMMAEALPRAKGQFACPVVSQAKRSLTPGVRAGWADRWRCHPYNPATGQGEYVLWREPPAGFDRPYQEPDNWDNCICFANGFVIELCGYKLDADSHRGRNDDFVLMDEGLRFKKEWLKIALGRIRANVGKYDSPLHWLFAFFSSPAYSADGDWMYEYEELSRAQPEKYVFVKVRTADNRAFLPPGYMKGLKESLTDLEYRVEVLGERLSKIPKSYYPALNWDHHTDIEDLERFYDPEAPLEISCDFNAHFTCGTVWQSQGTLLKHQCPLFVKEPALHEATGQPLTMSQTLGVRFVERFRTHPRKRVYVTGDRNGQNKSAGSALTMFEQFAEVLEDAGWEVILCPLTYNPGHYEKYLLVHGILSETDPDGYVVRMHPTEAKSTLVSMTFTPITNDYGKDKRSEKGKGDQEKATHLSDTVDYYLVWKKKAGFVYEGGGFDIDFM